MKQMNFSISDRDFNDRKKIWEVLLRKQKIETNKSAVVIKPGIEARVMLGGIRFVKEDKGPIFVIDGIVFTNSKAVNPNDIESTTVLKASDAVVIYGPQGSNGAIIITTKQLKEITLDTVFISATERTNIKGAMVCTTSVMGSMVKGVSLKSTIADSLNIIDAKINASLNVYPNPVQRGNTINLSLKCKQTGLHQIQITDVNGRTVFYKRINAVTKEQTEMILCDGKWSAGLYYISLYDNKNKLVNKNSFIIQ